MNNVILKIQNTFFHHNDIHRYAWHQERKNEKSIIDLIIIKQSTPDTIKDVRVLYRGTDCVSAHCLFKAKIGCYWLKCKAKISSKRTEVKYYYPVFKVEFLQDESIQGNEKRVRCRLNVHFEDTTDELCNHLKQILNAVALVVLSTRCRNDGNSNHWSIGEIIKCIQEKKDAFLNCLNKIDDVSL